MNEIQSLLEEWKKTLKEQAKLEITHPIVIYKNQQYAIYDRFNSKLQMMFLELQKEDITSERFHQLIKITKRTIENGKYELNNINELEQLAIKAKKEAIKIAKEKKEAIKKLDRTEELERIYLERPAQKEDLESELSISFVDKLGDGHKFEEYIAELLKKLGYINVEVTPGSGDYGIDILAKKNDITYAIQCKHYLSGNVGIDAVQQVFTGKEHYNKHIRSSYNK